MKRLDVYCDGGARGNPGPAAAAFVVLDGSNLLVRDGKYLGKATNNVAEYSALLLGLDWLLKNNLAHVGEVNIYMDSQLIVRQMKGEYKIKSDNIKTLAMEAKKKEKRLEVKVKYFEVPREKNSDADFLVNKILDDNSST